MKLVSKGTSLADFVKDEVDVIITDIEGTTTPITFVTEVLFPYIKENVKTYLKDNWQKEEVAEDVDALQKLAEEDISNGVEDVPKIDGSDEDSIESIVRNVLWQMSKDRKSTALKQLQGNMWRSAYKDGTIKSKVYDDVPEVLKHFKQEGKGIYVYSSGSVPAQKLLFGYSEHGDLNHIFSGYFDTKIGGKKESTSYKAIADSIGVKADRILFLTDVYAEAKAAKEAKMSACILLRPGNKALSEEEINEFTAIKTFHELTADEPKSKQRKLDE